MISWRIRRAQAAAAFPLDKALVSGCFVRSFEEGLQLQCNLAESHDLDRLLTAVHTVRTALFDHDALPLVRLPRAAALDLWCARGRAQLSLFVS